MEKTTAKRGKKMDTPCRKVVLARMFDRSIRLIDIAETVGTERSQITRVLDGTRFSEIVQDSTAKLLGLDRNILFSNRRCSRRAERAS